MKAKRSLSLRRLLNSALAKNRGKPMRLCSGEGIALGKDFPLTRSSSGCTPKIRTEKSLTTHSSWSSWTEQTPVWWETCPAARATQPQRRWLTSCADRENPAPPLGLAAVRGNGPSKKCTISPTNPNNRLIAVPLIPERLTERAINKKKRHPHQSLRWSSIPSASISSSSSRSTH
jgi:hypothetical protein